jgi:catechol 2,3-dioxygenase-like lactoylglutathione lyase family enzyme
MSHLELVALVVRDCDAAIRFFVDVLQFELVEDTPSLTNDGRPKRWVVVRPIGGQSGILLARADGQQQMGTVGRQLPVVSECSCASMTSTALTSGWSQLECSSSRRLAMSHTADLQCFWILRGTDGTS